MPVVINLYDAKTQLSALVDRAAAGEEIVIAKNGSPRARLVPLTPLGAARTPADALGVSFVAEDFDAFDPAIGKLFNGD
jgi:prevent-host-death family protein